MGMSAGSVFGKKDPSATNQVDAQGNVVATNTPGSKTVADPNQGLSNGQMLTRGLTASGLSGLSQLGQQAQPRSAPQSQINFAPQSPQYQPVVHGATKPKYSPMTSYTGNPFFGSYGSY